MEDSKIEWTDHTFNPWIGCEKVSDGCLHCYAEQMSKRYGWAEWGPNGKRKKTSEANWRKPLSWNRKAEKEGRRYKVFCGSLCDVFEDNEQTIWWLVELFELIEQTPNLDWLLLTKRPENIYDMWPRIPTRWDPRFEEYNEPHKTLSNVWLGTTVENEELLGKRLDTLFTSPADKYFVSVEPMLSRIWLGDWLTIIDWVICGGESGPGCRPFNVEWARRLLKECRAEGVPFFMKQLGGYPDKRDKLSDFPEDLRVREFPDD